jgi:uncharacterized protein (DUF488 family)
MTGKNTPNRTKSDRKKIRDEETRGVIFTIGHSTRPLAEFIELLKSNGVQRVIDIRTIPRSRHNPQFGQVVLATALRNAGIGYVYLKKLGGRRRPRSNSINTGWRNTSFRGYADYMQTAEFLAGLERAVKLACTKTSALMCAEAVPWRCHRSLVADAFAARDIPVLEIISKSNPRLHRLTPFARVHGTTITYPANSPAR